MSEVENPYANPVPTAPPLSPAEEKQWAVLTHVLGIFFGVVSAGAFYFLFRDRGPFVKHHVTTEWNFQLTVTIVFMLGFIVSFASVFVASGAVSGGTSSSAAFSVFFIGYVVSILARIAALVLGIRAAMSANRGNYYTYPAFRFVK